MEVGEKVSMEKWNQTVPPNKRVLGPCTIIDKKYTQSCQSGVMYELDKYPNWLDEAWLIKWESK